MAIKVLMVGSEMVPYAATGGLGDVLGSLPEACMKGAKKDFDIRVIMPLYGSIGEEYRSQMTFLGDITVPLAWRKLYCGIFKLLRQRRLAHAVLRRQNAEDGWRSILFFGQQVLF